jgi:hypothetical protein
MNLAVSKQCFDSSSQSEQDFYSQHGYKIIGSQSEKTVSAGQTMTRAGFDNMTPKQRCAFIKNGGRVV